MGYLHGVEIKEITDGAYPIRVVNSAVIGLVGTAIKGPVNEPVLITSMPKAKEIFGNDVGGLTIMSALETIFANGGATCVVVNVADAITLKSKVLTAKGDEVKKLTTTGDAVKKVSGNYVTKIYNASISGDGDFTAKVVAGFDFLLAAEGTFGVKPKVLISPGYSQIASVLTKAQTAAERLTAKVLVDMAADKIINAVGKRKTTYNISDDRVILCFPGTTRYNAHQGETQQAGLSQFVAAAIASRDAEQGYWHSPSNYELKGILGAKVPITASLTDENADTNALNRNGIVTLFRSFGTGYRIWGNWTSAYPTNSGVMSMIAPGRTRDVLDESVQQAALQYMDKPINQALTDSIRLSVNNFIRTLIGRGAIVDGTCTYDTAANPATEVAQGKLRFRITFVPAPSLDRLTFESFVDINLLNSIT